MPSPFPGMDPYLEAPGLWAGFHHRFADELAAELNESLPSPYYADIEIRSELGIVEGGRTRQRIMPDAGVLRSPRLVTATRGTIALKEPRRERSKSVEYVVELDMIDHPYVEIRDSQRGHKLITLIEILSLSNKQPGPDREAYLRKQHDVLFSDANLIEIDLHRAGMRTLPEFNLGAIVSQIDPPADYLVLVSRASQRTERISPYEIFPFTIREWLPCISVPLRKGEPEVPLDLQFVFNRAFDRGPYRRGAVDYSRPPEPPLAPEDAAWAETLRHPDTPKES